MVTVVQLPRLGANIVEGVVGAWRRREGERVQAGEPLVEIITSKATFDVDAPAEGTLLKIVAPEKSAVPIGYVLGILGESGDTLPDVGPQNERALADFRAQAHPEAAPQSAAKVRATPGARKLAKEANLDLAQIPLPAGRDILREEDVRAFIEGKR